MSSFKKIEIGVKSTETRIVGSGSKDPNKGSNHITVGLTKDEDGDGNLEDIR